MIENISRDMLYEDWLEETILYKKDGVEIAKKRLVQTIMDFHNLLSAMIGEEGNCNCLIDKEKEYKQRADEIADKFINDVLNKHASKFLKS